MQILENQHRRPLCGAASPEAPARPQTTPPGRLGTHGRRAGRATSGAVGSSVATDCSSFSAACTGCPIRCRTSLKSLQTPRTITAPAGSNDHPPLGKAESRAVGVLEEELRRGRLLPTPAAGRRHQLARTCAAPDSNVPIRSDFSRPLPIAGSCACVSVADSPDSFGRRMNAQTHTLYCSMAVHIEPCYGRSINTCHPPTPAPIYCQQCTRHGSSLLSSSWRRSLLKYSLACIDADHGRGETGSAWSRVTEIASEVLAHAQPSPCPRADRAGVSSPCVMNACCSPTTTLCKRREQQMELIASVMSSGSAAERCRPAGV